MQETSDSFALTPYLSITRRETDIIDCLTDHQEMPRDFEENQVRSFFVGKDFHLALYFAHEQDRGFQMFIVRDFSIHVEELCMLRDLLAQLIQQGQNVAMMKKAHYRVDHILHMAHTFRALMHNDMPLSEEDYLPGALPNRQD